MINHAPAPVRAFKALAVAAMALFLAYVALDAPERVVADRAPVTTSPAYLLDQHGDDCWTGEQPADVDFPGHVIWQHPDGRTVYSARLVGPALDAIFGDGDLQGDIVAFCR